MIKRAKIRVNGIVQGVGFRPFIHKQISDSQLTGWVRNTSTGAELELEGEEAAVKKFADEIWTKAPKLALIAKVELEWLPTLEHFTEFKIISSKGEEKRNTLISPDVCICDECLAELRSPGKRYRYPYINCTNCGPRFTIIRDVPYDRKMTTMAPFPMCPECNEQYTTITDRRYHAEPTGCNECGPTVAFLDASGQMLSGPLQTSYGESIPDNDPFVLARKYLREGKIIAIKGLGGYHLACRFDEADIPAKLRARKHRDEKPFAIMCRDIATARKYCRINAAEEKLLVSYRSPIVLLEKLDAGSYMQVSENGRMGVMLPYTPMQHLLMEEDIDALIMTSANLSDLPIIYKDEEALQKLSGIADGFLTGEREIHVRCDDSLCYELDGHEYLVRRSRGYVPYPIIMERELPMLLACGAEQKASFTMSKGNYAFASQHIGDMKSIETLENYTEQVGHFERIFDIKPAAIACDLHPDFYSTEYAQARAKKLGVPLIKVQHHHAHMASCMADNNLEGEVIGIIWDGVGLGTDGNAWGGEFLVGGYKEYSRAGHIRYIPLPGGDKAVHEIWRVGASLLLDAYDGDVDAVRELGIIDETKLEAAAHQLQSHINSPLSSGMGRLFDGVAAILGIKQQASYEGQGAILLEAAADESELVFEYEIDESGVIDFRQMLRQLAEERISGTPISTLAAGFMNTVIDAAVAECKRIKVATGLDQIVLSGGTFNNMYIMHRLPKRLASEGFFVYHHRRVSCGDEGLSLGQLMIANANLGD